MNSDNNAKRPDPRKKMSDRAVVTLARKFEHLCQAEVAKIIGIGSYRLSRLAQLHDLKFAARYPNPAGPYRKRTQEELLDLGRVLTIDGIRQKKCPSCEQIKPYDDNFAVYHGQTCHLCVAKARREERINNPLTPGGRLRPEAFPQFRG